jgi:hypothetical protein
MRKPVQAKTGMYCAAFIGTGLALPACINMLICFARDNGLFG